MCRVGSFLYFKRKLCLFYLNELKRKEEKHREKDCPSTVESSNGCNGQRWAAVKQGVRGFFCVSHWVQEPMALGYLLLLSETRSKDQK